MEAITLRKGTDYHTVESRLKYINDNRQDRIIPLENMGMTEEGQLAYQDDKGGVAQFAMNTWSQGQVASYANIPKAYFDRIGVQNKQLLSLMVNHSFLHKRSEVPAHRREARMFRSLDGTLQALVSPSFLTLDGYELMQVLKPILDRYGFTVLEASITEKRLYVNAVTEALQGEVKQGDVINYGVTISTSDVGAGSISISPYLYRLICSNGLKTESHFKRRHLASSKAEGEDFRDLFTSQTVYHEKRAILGKAKDTLLASLREDNFNAELGRLKETTERTITNYNLQEVVERAGKFYGVTDSKVQAAVVNELGAGNQGAGLTMWGLMNSFTAVAKTEIVDYDEQDRLERIAGTMPKLTPKQWGHIAQTAR